MMKSQNIIKLMTCRDKLVFQPEEEFIPMNKNAAKKKEVRASIKIRNFLLNIQADIQRREIMILPKKKQLQKYEVPSTSCRYNSNFVKNLVSRTNSFLRNDQKKHQFFRENLSNSCRITPRSKKQLNVNNPEIDYKEMRGPTSPDNIKNFQYLQKVIGKSLKFEQKENQLSKNKTKIKGERCCRRLSTPEQSMRQVETIKSRGCSRGSRFLTSRPTTSSVIMPNKKVKIEQKIVLSTQFLQPW